MKMFSASAIAAAILAGIPGAFGGPVKSAPGRALVVTAYEYAFKSPDSVSSGIVTVRLVNRGKTGHQVSFARLDDSTTLLRVMRSLVANKERTTGIHWVGGVESALPGDSSEATIALHPGRYVIVCAYEGDSGHAHMSMGMLHALTVTGDASSSALVLAPTPASIRLSDYHIDVTGQLHAGQQLVRIENRGAHRHHLYIVRMVGKATLDDAAKWDGKSLPAPIEEIGGGLSVVDPGEAGVIKLDLVPARYALGCLLSDGTGGKPHYMLGMAEEIIVK